MQSKIESLSKLSSGEHLFPVDKIARTRDGHIVMQDREVANMRYLAPEQAMFYGYKHMLPSDIQLRRSLVLTRDL